MVKLIISQLDHSIPLIIFNSCLSLAELAGCGPLSLRSVKALQPALLESNMTSAVVDVKEVHGDLQWTNEE